MLDSARNKPHGAIYSKSKKFEEKGSDVNIANFLLADGFRDLYDAAVFDIKRFRFGGHYLIWFWYT